jgi:uncharacterized repeat protein (TIGR03803 family)
MNQNSRFCESSPLFESIPRMRSRRVRVIAPFTVASVLISILALAPGSLAASKFKTLYAFQGGTDGATPVGRLALDQAGNLYGATNAGGTNASYCTGEIQGCGTVFELQAGSGGSWQEMVLHRFQESGSSDGSAPDGDMIFDSAGNLYGSTISGGGATEQCSSGAGAGCGIVFELTPAQGEWTETVLYRFQINSGGAGPNGGLKFGKAGNLYGTAVAGDNCCGDIFGWGAGAAFELIPGSGEWTENVLYTFCSQSNCSDGNAPYAGLIWGAGGALYGTTAYGGSNSFPCQRLFGCGTVFQLAESGGQWKENVIYTFTGRDVGAQPSAALTADSAGNLYGTTSVNGPFGFGTVFKLTRGEHGRWNYAVLYGFRTGSFYGSFATRPVFDKTGNLYGTIWTKGYGNCEGLSCGLVYKLAPQPHGKWKYSVVYTFSGGTDGGFPGAELLLDDKGNLYGSTEIGGTAGYGVVFEITP